MRPGVLILLLCLSATAMPQDKHREILRGKFQSDLQAIVDDYEGVAGLHIVDLTSGDRFAVRDDLQFPQASAIKVPVLLELFRRAESEPGLLNKRVEMTDEIRTLGSGVLRYLTDGGSSLSLHDHAIYMILYSDNTATNVLIDELGMDRVHRFDLSTQGELGYGCAWHPNVAQHQKNAAELTGFIRDRFGW